jgi:hypothetical protein
MATINIKELFASDLNPNEATWWSIDKISKINYNFSQMTGGGVAGPRGILGYDGNPGPLGMQGVKGYQGVDGYQGVKGYSTEDVWTYRLEANSGISYLIPKYNVNSIQNISPVTLKIGFDINNAEYNTATSSREYVVIGNVASSSPSKINLRLQSETKVSDFKLDVQVIDNIERQTLHIGKIVTADAGFKQIIISNSTIIKSVGDTLDILNALSHSICDLNIVIGNTIRESFAELSRFPDKLSRANAEFQFNVNATEGDVLVSGDANGTVTWKDKNSLFGSFPIGSIISIRENEFNSSNFYLNEVISQSGNPLPVLRNRYGRGIPNTQYAGWYLCNGLSWEIENGVNSYSTPNLNSFQYTISSNEGDQNEIVLGGDGTSIIMAGYDISLAAVESNGVYNVSFDNVFQSNDDAISANDTFTFGLQDGSTNVNAYVSKMIHIVYLENDNLIWSVSDNVSEPPVTNSISLGYSFNNDSGEICKVSSSIEYTWNGEPGTWSTFRETLEETYLYNAGTTNLAPLGYYIDLTDNSVRFWNPRSLTFSGEVYCAFEQYETTSLGYSMRVDGINGNYSFLPGLNYSIDTVLFENATVLRDNNDSLLNADRGWYRSTSTGKRRYWNGSQFEGVIFTKNFIISISVGNGVTGFNNVTNTPSACGASILSRESFVEYDTSIIADLVFVHDNSLLVYVPINYARILNETPGLVSVISQPAPGSSYPFKRIYLNEMINSDLENKNALINAFNGTINFPNECVPNQESTR